MSVMHQQQRGMKNHPNDCSSNTSLWHLSNFWTMCARQVHDSLIRRTRAQYSRKASAEWKKRSRASRNLAQLQVKQASVAEIRVKIASRIATKRVLLTRQKFNLHETQPPSLAGKKVRNQWQMVVFALCLHGCWVRLDASLHKTFMVFKLSTLKLSTWLLTPALHFVLFPVIQR